jgi:hypothetical protein
MPLLPPAFQCCLYLLSLCTPFSTFHVSVSGCISWAALGSEGEFKLEKLI